jgi:pimeloyl-ACP methyl ester carboxylesterase
VLLGRVLSCRVWLVVAACGAMVQPMGASHGTPRLEADAAIAPDGYRLPLRHWGPVDKPRAVVLALHGFNEYGRAFDDPARFWGQLGIATYAYDQRGFGDTAGRGIWPGAETLAADAATALQLLEARYPSVPIYLLGESMGGAVAILAATGRSCPRATVGPSSTPAHARASRSPCPGARGPSGEPSRLPRRTPSGSTSTPQPSASAPSPTSTAGMRRTPSATTPRACSC